MADIVGIDKIVKYCEKYDFQRIVLKKQNDTIYTKRCKNEETQADLINDFSEWAEDFINDTNTREYKLELFGSYQTTPNVKLTSVVKLSVAFHEKAAVAGGYIQHSKIDYSKPQTQIIDLERYVNVATENATLKAQLERMAEKLDEFINEEEEEEEEIGNPPTLMGAISETLIGKIDTIIDVVLAKLMQPQQQITGINGIEENTDTLNEFRTIYPNIDEDLKRLLILAKTQPEFFKLLIQNLRNMVK